MTQLLVTGGSGVLGRAFLPLAREAGHQVAAPRHHDLDLFDPRAVRQAVEGIGLVVHLATRIPPPERMRAPGAWVENDRLRSVGSRLLVEAALEAGCEGYIQPTVTFVYPRQGTVDESSPIRDVPGYLASAIEAEAQAARFSGAGRRGVVLRFGLLWGPGTWSEVPIGRFGATLHVEDAGRALLAAVHAPAGLYNVVADGERVSTERFRRATGWRPMHGSFVKAPDGRAS